MVVPGTPTVVPKPPRPGAVVVGTDAAAVHSNTH